MIAKTLVPEAKQASATARGRLAFGLTRRALLLLLLGALWLAPAFFLRPFVWAMAAWDLLVLALAILDGRRLPQPCCITAERSWLGAPALDNETGVELAVMQRSDVLIYAALLDDLPAAFTVSPRPLAIEAYPAIRASIRYTFRARERGDHAAGKLYVRYHSGIGLVERWAVADLSQTVRIYPAIRSGEEQGLFLARTRQIELQIRRQRIRGAGREFESLREYREGDDPREICWTATARRGMLISRQHQIERSQPVWLVMDAGRLMQARVGGFTQLDYAATTALALAQLALVAGDRVGLLAYGHDIQQRVPLGRGSSHLREIMDAAAVVRNEPGEANHLRATVTLSRMQPTRSLILWLTDFAETAMRPEVIDGAAQMLRRHLLLFVAPQQKDLIELTRSEPRTPAEMFDQAAAQEMLQRREVLLARLRDQGALTLETAPQQMTAAVLNRYLEVKERN